MVGYYPKTSNIDFGRNVMAFDRLYRESSVRGLHAFGLAHAGEEAPFRTFHRGALTAQFNPSLPAIAHTRYCTSGEPTLEDSQPLVYKHAVNGNVHMVFNGVISQGTKTEMEREFGVWLDSNNDGEVFLQSVFGEGKDAAEFLSSIRGSFAGAWLTGDGRLFAGRNARRPLWRCEAYGAIWLASTKDIFNRAGFPEPTPFPVGVEQIQ